MVSIVLLTTEEVLQKNAFWHSLDTVWVTEELEPFEDVKQEHMFIKPLSRDLYYTKYPDIPRSESDEENSLSLNGFKSKHREWKSKICVRRLNAQRRNSSQSYLSSCDARFTRSGSLSSANNRVTSVVKTNNKENPSESNYYKIENDNERAVEFLKRLQQSVPPPPIEDFHNLRDVNFSSTKASKSCIDFNNIELPEYEDFVHNKMTQIGMERNILLTTSTLKKSKRNKKKYHTRAAMVLSRSIYV